MNRFLHALLVLGAGLALFGMFAFFYRSIPVTESLVVQNVNNYFGPSEKIPGNPDLIRVQVLIYDDPNPQGVKISSVIFNGQTIPLKPADIWGFRGQGSFQLRPNKYALSWKVKRSSTSWPRNETQKQEVELDARDLWIQITIHGDQASIT